MRSAKAESQLISLIFNLFKNYIITLKNFLSAHNIFVFNNNDDTNLKKNYNLMAVKYQKEFKSLKKLYLKIYLLFLSLKKPIFKNTLQ